MNGRWFIPGLAAAGIVVALAVGVARSFQRGVPPEAGNGRDGGFSSSSPKPLPLPRVSARTAYPAESVEAQVDESKEGADRGRDRAEGPAAHRIPADTEVLRSGHGGAQGGALAHRKAQHKSIGNEQPVARVGQRNAVRSGATSMENDKEVETADASEVIQVPWDKAAGGPAQLPAALGAWSPDSDLTDGEGAGATELAEEFFDRLGVGDGVLDPASPEYATRWREAQEESDALLRARYGQHAWMRLHVESYRGALRDAEEGEASDP